MLVGWDDGEDFYGWFVGTIHSTTVTARDLRKTPSANFVVKYSSQRTGGLINGCVACELSEGAQLRCEQLVGPLREALSAWIGS